MGPVALQPPVLPTVAKCTLTVTAGSIALQPCAANSSALYLELLALNYLLGREPGAAARHISHASGISFNDTRPDESSAAAIRTHIACLFHVHRSTL